jgi:hypothetical protein
MHATRFSNFKTTSSVITTYEKGFDNLWLITNTTASSQRTPAGFDFNLRLEPTQQQAHKELLQDLQQYNYGLVTTQQQAHKELLQDLLSIYGLNRHT